LLSLKASLPNKWNFSRNYNSSGLATGPPTVTGTNPPAPSSSGSSSPLNVNNPDNKGEKEKLLGTGSDTAAADGAVTGTEAAAGAGEGAVAAGEGAVAAGEGAVVAGEVGAGVLGATAATVAAPLAVAALVGGGGVLLYDHLKHKDKDDSG